MNANRETDLEKALVRVASESWRLLKTVQRVQLALDADPQRRLAGRISFFERTLQEELDGIGLKLVDFTGQRFGPEIAASAINAEEFDASDELIVDQTVEPAVVGPDGLIRSGTVILRRGAR